MTDIRTRILGLLRPHVAGITRSTLADNIVTAAEICHTADIERRDRANAELALKFAAVSVERDSLRGVAHAVEALAEQWHAMALVDGADDPAVPQTLDFCADELTHALLAAAVPSQPAEGQR